MVMKSKEEIIDVEIKTKAKIRETKKGYILLFPKSARIKVKAE